MLLVYTLKYFPQMTPTTVSKKKVSWSKANPPLVNRCLGYKYEQDWEMGLYVTCDLSMTSWVVVKLELTYEQTDRHDRKHYLPTNYIEL